MLDVETIVASAPGDPLDPRKRNAPDHESAEIRIAGPRGHPAPADLADHAPRLFREAVGPSMQPALGQLDRTLEGKAWRAQLCANLFVEEPRRDRRGPWRA